MFEEVRIQGTARHGPLKGLVSTRRGAGAAAADAGFVPETKLNMTKYFKKLDAAC